MHVTIEIRSARILAELGKRAGGGLALPAVATRDLARSSALLDDERPGALVGPWEALVLRDALPRLGTPRREDGEPLTLAEAVEQQARSGAAVHGVDVAALAERLRGLRPPQLRAVIDLAEWAADRWQRDDPAEARRQHQMRFGTVT